jgi:hypothetical protein
MPWHAMVSLAPAATIDSRLSDRQLGVDEGYACEAV